MLAKFNYRGILMHSVAYTREEFNKIVHKINDSMCIAHRVLLLNMNISIFNIMKYR